MGNSHWEFFTLCVVKSVSWELQPSESLNRLDIWGWHVKDRAESGSWGWLVSRRSAELLIKGLYVFSMWFGHFTALFLLKLLLGPSREWTFDHEISMGYTNWATYHKLYVAYKDKCPYRRTNVETFSKEILGVRICSSCTCLWFPTYSRAWSNRVMHPYSLKGSQLWKCGTLYKMNGKHQTLPSYSQL